MGLGSYPFHSILDQKSGQSHICSMVRAKPKQSRLSSMSSSLHGSVANHAKTGATDFREINDSQANFSRLT